MARELTIRIQGDNSDWKAKAGETDRDIDSLTERAKAVGTQFTGWGKALLPVSVAVGAIGVGIIAMAKRGAGVSDVADQFDFFSKRAQASADIMLGALRRGTHGSISDFELMKAANLAMGNGLRANAGEMETLASGAKLLSGRIGGETLAAYDVLTGAIAKGSTATLKQIGLYVDQDAALQTYATSIGKTVSALDDQEQMAAIQMGVLAALRAEVDASGGAQASFGDKLDGAAARFTNMIDRISVMASNSKGLADVVDIVTSGLGLLLDVVETVAGWFEKIPAPIQSVVVVLGALIAAAGPVLIIVGQLITAFGAILPLFAAGTTGAGILAGAITLLTGPVGLVIAAVVALGAIWYKWGDDITRIVVGAYTAVKTWLWDKLEPVLTPIIGLVKSIGEMFWAFHDLVRAVAEKVFFWLVDKMVGAFITLKDMVMSVVGAIGNVLGKIPDGLLPLLGPIGAVVLAFRHWDKISAIVLAVYTAVKMYLVDKFNAIVDSVKAKVDAVTGFFKDMYMKVVGGSFVPDMIDGIASNFGRVHEVMVTPAQAAAQAVIGIFSGLKDSVGGSIQGLLSGLHGGGGFGGALQGLVGGLFGSGGGLNSLLNSGLSSLATSIGGGFVGKLATSLSSLIPGIGPLLGPVIGKLGGKVISFLGNAFGGGNDTKKDRESFAKSLGFDLPGFYDELREMGPKGNALVHEALNVIGKKDKGANAAWIQKVQELFATWKDESTEAAAVVEASSGAMMASTTQAITGSLNFMTDSVQGSLMDVQVAVSSTMENMHTSASGALKDLARDVSGTAANLRDLFSEPIPVTFEFDTTSAPTFSGGVSAAVQPRTSYAAMGGWVTPEGVKYFDTGGWVRRGTDSVRAMLTPGEFVVNRRGVAALSALNQGKAGTLAGSNGNQHIQVQIGEEVILDVVERGFAPRLKFKGVIR